jgi:drug/metabolite transporter (DMT)-like permease
MKAPTQRASVSTRSATAVGAAILALTMWSGTAIANKVAVAYMDGLTAGVLRSLLAGGVAAVIAVLLRLPAPRSPRELTLLAVSGVSSFAIWPATISVGIAHTTAGHAALIMAMIPIFTVLFGALADKRLPRGSWWLAAAAALAATVMLMFSRGIRLGRLEDGSSLAGDLTILAGCAICSVGYVSGAQLAPRIGTVATTFWGLAAALIALVPAFAAVSGATAWVDVPLRAWIAIGWMTLLSSLAGYALWFFALGSGGIGRIGSLQLAMPAVTLAAASVVLGEAVSPRMAVLCAAIVVATFFAQQRAR